MKNTPSALKWLAEKRGRLAHDLGQTRQIAADVNARVSTLEADLAAVDRAIAIFDATINPERIEPVNAHGRYGKRGALKESILEVLRAHAKVGIGSGAATPEFGKTSVVEAEFRAGMAEEAPETVWVSTVNIEMLVCLELGLTFETPAVRKRWYDNSFAKQLRRLVVEGLVERQHDAANLQVEMGRWRWLPIKRRLTTLAALVDSQND